MRSINVLFGALALSACATTTDPTEGGLIGGIHGLATGAYQERIRQREESLQRLSEIQGKLKGERTTLKATKQSKSAEISEQKRQLTVLLKDTNILATEVEQLQTTLARNQVKKRKLGQQLTGLQGKIRELEQESDQGMRVEQLEEQRAALEKEYRLLLDLYLQLGQ